MSTTYLSYSVLMFAVVISWIFPFYDQQPFLKLIDILNKALLLCVANFWGPIL